MEVGQSDEAILARERDGLIAALCLGDAEDLMILRIEDRDGAMVVEDQPTGLRKTAYRRSFCAPTAPGCPNPDGHQSDDPDR